jgi:hypothetical protein
MPRDPLPPVGHGFTPAQILALRPEQGRPRPVSQVPSARPPGAPPAGAPPRLPDLGGVVPYAPVVPPPILEQQQAPILGVSDTYEAATTQLQWPLNVEATVYTARQRWRACDVYVELPNQGDPFLADGGQRAYLSIFVYARSVQGARTLVASGRMGPYGDQSLPTFPLVAQRWVAAARADAERYEVTAQFTCNNALTLAHLFDAPIRVTTVLTDEMTQAPPLVGVAPALGQVGTAIRMVAAGTRPPVPQPELVGVQCVIDTGAGPAARFLHLHDSAALNLNGHVPLAIWPLGNEDGQGISDFNMAIRLGSPGTASSGLALVSSSTAAITTLANDCPMQAWFR